MSRKKKKTTSIDVIECLLKLSGLFWLVAQIVDKIIDIIQKLS